MKLSLISVLLVLLATAMLFYLPFGGPAVEIDGEAVAELSLHSSLVRAAAACATMLLMLRVLDYMTHIDFKATWANLDTPHALYLAARFLGVCLLLASIFS